MERRAATTLANEMSSDDPEVGLRAVASLRALVDSVEELQVESARQHGWTWQEIARVLGVSKQAVHQKYAGGRRLFRRGAG
jgi:DNA-directed RNA polymerase specialized sigma24 family protein